jgi:hypothetical protein
MKNALSPKGRTALSGLPLWKFRIAQTMSIHTVPKLVITFLVRRCGHAVLYAVYGDFSDSDESSE